MVCLGKDAQHEIETDQRERFGKEINDSMVDQKTISQTFVHNINLFTHQNSSARYYNFTGAGTRDPMA